MKYIGIISIAFEILIHSIYCYSIPDDCKFNPNNPLKPTVKIIRDKLSSNGLNDQEISTEYVLYSQNGNFDPKLKTIFYIQGGPHPKTQLELPPFFTGIQYIILNYRGTRCSSNLNIDLNVKNYKNSFSSDQQAQLIKNVIKRENLSNYVIWGHSHGVQLAIRTIDRINKSNLNKPKSVLLDSGSGHMVSKSIEEKNSNDLIEINTIVKLSLNKCHISPSSFYKNGYYLINFKIDKNTSKTKFLNYIKECNLKIYPPMKEYIDKCYIEQIASLKSIPSIIDKYNEISLQLYKNHFFEFFHESDDLYKMPCTSLNMDWLKWRNSLVCGLFKEDYNTLCGETKLNINKLSMGNIPIVGIKGGQDTNNPGSMEKLINSVYINPNNSSKKSENVKLFVSPESGHISFFGDDYKKCRSGILSEQLKESLFSNSAQNIYTALEVCHNKSLENIPDDQSVRPVSN